MSQTQAVSTAGSLPPGPGVPAFVQFAMTWRRPTRSLIGTRQTYGKRFTARLPFQPPIVMLSDPDEIKQVFQLAPDVAHPGAGGGLLEPILGRYSLITLDEDLHLEHRRLLLPPFHGEHLKAMTELMRALVDSELSRWPLARPVALHPYLQRLTLAIILRTVFGVEQGEREEKLRAAVTRVLKIAESPVSLMLPALRKHAPWLPAIRRMRRLLAETDAEIYALVSKRRAATAAGADPTSPDVLSMLLAARHEDGSPMGDTEIRDELMTALVAGHETTASQLAWTLALLAHDQRVIGKLRAEQQAGAEDAYLTATLNEVQRLWPVVPNAEPRLTMRPVTVGGHTYPAGVLLVPSAFLVHRDPELYPDPSAFSPERFLGVTPGTYTWIPFGGGRRRCLGSAFATLEMKLVLTAAVERFEIEPGQAEPELPRRRSITISPSSGCSVILRRRPPRPTRRGADHAVAPRPTVAAPRPTVAQVV